MTKKSVVILVSCIFVIAVLIVSVVSKAGNTPKPTKDDAALNADVQEKVCTLLQAGSELYNKIPYENFFDDSLDDLLALSNPTEEQQAQIVAYFDESVKKMREASEGYGVALDAVASSGLNMNLDELKAYGENCQFDTVEPQPASAGSSIAATRWYSKRCYRAYDIHVAGAETGNIGLWLSGAIGVLIFC